MKLHWFELNYSDFLILSTFFKVVPIFLYVDNRCFLDDSSVPCLCSSATILRMFCHLNMLVRYLARFISCKVFGFSFFSSILDWLEVTWIDIIQPKKFYRWEMNNCIIRYQKEMNHNFRIFVLLFYNAANSME